MARIPRRASRIGVAADGTGPANTAVKRVLFERYRTELGMHASELVDEGKDATIDGATMVRVTNGRL
jgi:hypothetical protein